MSKVWQLRPSLFIPGHSDRPGSACTRTVYTLRPSATADLNLGLFGLTDHKINHGIKRDITTVIMLLEGHADRMGSRSVVVLLMVRLVRGQFISVAG